MINSEEKPELFIGVETTNIELFVSPCCGGLLSIESLITICCGICGMRIDPDEVIYKDI